MLRFLFLCDVLKALFFIKIALKLSYFCKKMQNFERWGLRPQTPKTAPPLQISGYAPGFTDYSPSDEELITRETITESSIVSQRWKPVGSRFFDRPVKPFETPVKLSFLATKRYLSTSRNIHRYFIINKIFYKKTVLTNHTFWKQLFNGFKLWLISCDH